MPTLPVISLTLPDPVTHLLCGKWSSYGCCGEPPAAGVPYSSPPAAGVPYSSVLCDTKLVGIGRSWGEGLDKSLRHVQYSETFRYDIPYSGYHRKRAYGVNVSLKSCVDTDHM